ncbi:MAG: hypothetical protein ACJ8C4_03985 [Gemmataceae bacterium]
MCILCEECKHDSEYNVYFIQQLNIAGKDKRTPGQHTIRTYVFSTNKTHVPATVDSGNRGVAPCRSR